MRKHLITFLGLFLCQLFFGQTNNISPSVDFVAQSDLTVKNGLRYFNDQLFSGETLDYGKDINNEKSFITKTYLDGKIIKKFRTFSSNKPLYEFSVTERSPNDTFHLDLLPYLKNKNNPELIPYISSKIDTDFIVEFLTTYENEIELYTIQGKVYDYYESNCIEYLQENRDFKIISETFFHGDCNKIFRKNTYQNGVLNGISVTYKPNGEIWDKGEYLDGEKTGLWIFNEEDSIREETYFLNGLKEGESKVYYLFDNSFILGKYINDKKEGDFIRYTSNNEVVYKETYENNLITKRIYYYKDGIISSIEDFDENQLSNSKYFYKNGQIRYDSGKDLLYLENGDTNGSFIERNDEGFIIEEGKIKNGKRIGKWISYSSDGQRVTSKRSYKKGVLNGKSTSYLFINKPTYIDLSTEDSMQLLNPKGEKITVDDKDLFDRLSNLSNEYYLTQKIIERYRNGSLEGLKEIHNYSYFESDMLILDPYLSSITYELYTLGKKIDESVSNINY